MYNYYLNNHLGNLRQRELIQQAEERRMEIQSDSHGSPELPPTAQHDRLPQRLIHLFNHLLH
jgi:hypothetical protein